LIVLLLQQLIGKKKRVINSVNLDQNDNNNFIIDGGANIGYRQSFLHKNIPNANFSIEASKNIYQQLLQNCELNNLDRSKILFINKALSDSESKNAEFYEIESMSTILKEFLLDIHIYRIRIIIFIYTNEIVKIMTIDNIVISENIDKILLMKIDVEGASSGLPLIVSLTKVRKD
jgi:FkbM family methyltransferase